MTFHGSPSQAIPPGHNRAIVVVGAAAEGDWRPRPLTIQLYEYGMDRQSITGNCWRWNKLEATADGMRDGVEYFAFDVAPGFYAGGVSAQFAHSGTVVAKAVPGPTLHMFVCGP